MRGLEGAIALGVTTNQAFLAMCVDHPAFARGEATTAFLEEHGAYLHARDDESEARPRVLGRVGSARGRAHSFDSCARSGSEHGPLRARRARRPRASSLFVGTASKRIPGRRLVDTLAFRQRIVMSGENTVTLVARAPVFSRSTEGRLFFALRGRTYSADDANRPRGAAAEARAGDGKVRATMNGRLATVLCVWA